MFGNLLTLPIGGTACSTSSRCTSRARAENSFPLLQKVLVNYGDRVGYADTLAEALDQVFGAGAGEVGERQRRGSGRRRRHLDPDVAQLTDHAASPTTTSPPPDGGGTTEPGHGRRGRRHQRRRSTPWPTRSATGDFAAQGQALEDLQAAVEAYQEAQAAAESPGG